MTQWTLLFICCGRDDGSKTFDSWEAADAFRDSYTSGPSVGENGHDRAAILTSTPDQERP